MRRRRALAAGLEHAVRDARQSHRGRTAAVPVDRAEVLLAEPSLIELADQLRDRYQPVERDVLEAVESMLTQPESPLHAPRYDGELRDWARSMRRPIAG